MLTRNRRPNQSPLETLSDLKSHIRRLKDARRAAIEDTAPDASVSHADASREEPRHPSDRLSN